MDRTPRRRKWSGATCYCRWRPWRKRSPSRRATPCSNAATPPRCGLPRMAACALFKPSSGCRRRPSRDLPQMKFLLPALAILSAVFAPVAHAAEVVVRTAAELKEALRAPAAGTTLRIGPGEYGGGWSVAGISNLTVEALDKKA